MSKPRAWNAASLNVRYPTYVTHTRSIPVGDSPDYAWASTAGGEVLTYAYQKADRLDTQVRWNSPMQETAEHKQQHLTYSLPP